MAIDAIAQLALSQKAKQVFGGENTFLSFPITPLQYTKNDLSFVQNFNVSRLKEFSLLVNLIPTGQAWQPTTSQFLWDTYGDILGGHDTEVAQSTRTAQEEVQYQQAIQFLTVQGQNGWPEEPSPAVKAYNQFRDQWFVLQERYNAAKLTGETTTDSTLRNHWLTVEEPQLRQQLQNLDTRWINEGFKQEVEQFQSVRSRLGAKNPHQTWGAWNSKFDPNINALTDIDGVEFYPSSFSPMNALEAGSWQTFNLTRDEVNAMVNAAPAELRTRLAADLQASDIESISLEFSSAGVLRTWMDSDLFKARFWRFTDRSRQLSNGNTPPVGQCPAYVSAVVFARNITVKRRVPPPAPAPVPTPTPAPAPTPAPPVVVRPIRPRPDILIDPTDFPKGKKYWDRPPVMMKMMASPTPTLDLAYPILNATTAPKWDTSALAAAANQSLKINQPLANASALTPPINTTPNAVQIQSLPTLNQRIDGVKRLHPRVTLPAAELTSQAFLRLRQEAVIRPTLPQTAKAPDDSSKVTTASTGTDQIYILAFICKPLPLSPNPDPALQW